LDGGGTIADQNTKVLSAGECGKRKKAMTEAFNIIDVS
jgi:hypothetical protein